MFLTITHHFSFFVFVLLFLFFVCLFFLLRQLNHVKNWKSRNLKFPLICNFHLLCQLCYVQVLTSYVIFLLILLILFFLTLNHFHWHILTVLFSFVHFKLKEKIYHLSGFGSLIIWNNHDLRYQAFNMLSARSFPYLFLTS